MRKQKDDIYLVALNGYYVEHDHLSIGSIGLTKKEEKAHVFTNLKKAVKYAREIRGEVLFYGHRRTEFHVFNGMYQFEDHDEEE